MGTPAAAMKGVAALFEDNSRTFRPFFRRRCGIVSLDRRPPKIAINTAKSQPDLARGGRLAVPRTKVQRSSWREIRNVNARREIREVLLMKKMRHWEAVATCPLLDRSCPPARARKNFWRLCRTYPEIAARLGLTVTSVYGLP